jgi:[pyruvate, water dikinase]-phosphate phosphotransferase / [pyruvate, water dikinase] kinase
LTRPAASVLEPVLQLLQSYLGTASGRRIGAQHVLDAEYFQRIDALNFTMMHDDGQLAGSLEEADVVLVGISRTSKTPTSIYLANRGVKTANIPIVPGIPLPAQLETVKKPLVVGLIASPERIVALRENRILSLNAATPDNSYVDKAAIAAEIAFTRKLCTRNSWPIIDVTRRSIEETAAAILALRQAAKERAEAGSP